MVTAMAVLAVIGLLAVLNSGRRQAARSMNSVRAVAHAGGVAFRAVFAAGVILAVEWVVIDRASDNVAVLLGVLAVPALFAGASIARLLTVTDVGHTRGGGYR